MRRSIQLATALILISSIFVIVIHGDESENNPPQVTIPTETPKIYEQYQRILIKPVGTDVDPDDELTFHINMEEELNGEESVVDQLSLIYLTEGVDWGFNYETGEFWWQIDDQEIWTNINRSLDSVSVKLVFGIQDMSGLWAYDSIYLALNNKNEPPEDPDRIHFIVEGGEVDTDGYAGYSVSFWVDEVNDPDGDPLSYRWEFGDGMTAIGREVWHTYAYEGYKTVQMWVDDGEYESERIHLRIEITEPDEDRWDDDDVSEPVTSSSTSTVPLLLSMIFAICIMGIVVFILIVLVIIVLISRLMKKR